MKYRSCEVPSCSMSEPADNVRIANTVEGDRFVLEVLDQRPFKIGIEIVLEKHVKRLNNDLTVWRLGRSESVTRNEDLGVTPAPEQFDNVITLVDPAIT